MFHKEFISVSGWAADIPQCVCVCVREREGGEGKERGIKEGRERGRR